MLIGRRSTSTPIGARQISEPAPQPIEITTSHGTVIRGLTWSTSPDWIVLVHDLGDDLDDWGSFPATLAVEGCSVLAIDLPGHGLSDDSVAGDTFASVLEDVVVSIRAQSDGKCFAVGIGRVVPEIGRAGFDAMVAISPQPEPGWAGERSGPPCLILVGSADAQAADDADRYFRDRTGWTVSSSFGVTANGRELLASSWRDHIHEQITAFLRDYR